MRRRFGFAVSCFALVAFGGVVHAQILEQPKLRVDEKVAMAHSKFHKVVATMPSQEETPFRVVGKCFRCGMKFYTKSTWIAHELGMKQTRPTNSAAKDSPNNCAWAKEIYIPPASINKPTILLT